MSESGVSSVSGKHGVLDVGGELIPVETWELRYSPGTTVTATSRYLPEQVAAVRREAFEALRRGIARHGLRAAGARGETSTTSSTKSRRKK